MIDSPLCDYLRTTGGSFHHLGSCEFLHNAPTVGLPQGIASVPTNNCPEAAFIVILSLLSLFLSCLSNLESVLLPLQMGHGRPGPGRDLGLERYFPAWLGPSWGFFFIIRSIHFWVVRVETNGEFPILLICTGLGLRQSFFTQNTGIAKIATS